MATIKSFTDIEQSTKLAEILPLESADMLYWAGEYITHPYMEGQHKDEQIPIWSFVALLGVLPKMIGNIFEKDALRLRIDKSETDFNVWYENLDTGMVEEGLDIIKSNPVDACVEMIIRLRELNLL